MEEESSVERVIGIWLRIMLLTETGLFTVQIEWKNSGNMADQGDWQRTLSDYVWPTLNILKLTIVRLPVAANNFELKPVFVQMVQQSMQFHGLLDNVLNNHIRGFLEVCDMLKMNDIFDNAIRL